MPRPRSKSAAPSKKTAPAVAAAPQPGDVLTLAEAAAYLRTSTEEVLRLVRERGLPGQKVGGDYRFLRAAIQQWLSTPSAKPSLLDQLGAARDDPYLEDMLKEIYRRRGRPETAAG